MSAKTEAEKPDTEVRKAFFALLDKLTVATLLIMTDANRGVVAALGAREAARHFADAADRFMPLLEVELREAHAKGEGCGDPSCLLNHGALA